MTNVLLTLVIVTTTVLYSTSASAEDAESRQGQLQHQLNTEGISAWKQMQEAAQRLEVSGTQTRRMVSSGKVTSREQWQFKYRDGAMLAKSIESRPSDQEGFSGECRVRGVNPRYAFQIASKDGRSFDVYGFGTSTLKKSLAASIARYAIMITDAPWTAVGISLPDLLQRPEFTLLDISEQNIDGHQGIRAEYEFSPSPSHGNHDELYQKGWFRVDRGRQWRLQQLEATVHPPGDPEHIVKFRINVEYNEDRNGLPVPKRLTIVRGDGENATDQQFEYRVCDYRLLPDCDFTLSAFGLPEPNNAARQPDIDVVASTSSDGKTLHVNVGNRSPPRSASSVAILHAERVVVCCL